MTALLRFLCACLLLVASACGDDQGGGPVDPSDPEITEHLRVCRERCEQDVRCLAQPPILDDCLALCDAMAIPECIGPHADYFACTSLVTCDERYDDRLTAQCGDELTALFRACEPWRNPPQ